MLKRHLRTAFNMTPQQYRERWGLPPNYPMVAPDYAKQRSLLAKEIQLGRKRVEPEQSPPTKSVRRGQPSDMRAQTKRAIARSVRARP
jgi:predicted transcriptional regulator